jgi:hypothetical protein
MGGQIDWINLAEDRDMWAVAKGYFLYCVRNYYHLFSVELVYLILFVRLQHASYTLFYYSTTCTFTQYMCGYAALETEIFIISLDWSWE